VGPDVALRTTWARRVTAHGVGVRSPEGAGAALSPLLTDRPYTGVSTAYVCEHFACRAPARDAAALEDALDAVL
jgi:uncharacterized protein YyaL (SSP411 family)